MALWISWILLGILFLIAETFFLSWDFLALWISAILTGLFVKFLKFCYLKSLIWSSILFLVILSISWFLTKYLYWKFMKNTSSIPVNTNERILWQILIVQVVNGQKVVFFEGIYYPILNAEDVNVGDNVKVIKIEGNKVLVEKVL